MLVAMTKLQQDIHRLGELASMHELLCLGHSQTSIRGAVGRKELNRVRKGWYCLPSLGAEYQAAARVGGRLTCVSLAETLGLWIPRVARTGLHIAVPDNAAQLRSTLNYHDRLRPENGSNTVVHWNDDRRTGTRYATDMSSALARISRCVDLESAFVLCESALFKRSLTSDAWAEALNGMRAPDRSRLASAGEHSESGSESMFRYRAGVFGVRIRQQVWIGTDRVDFLLGDRLVVEIDSVAHHDPTNDAKRDARLSALGYRVLRFMYSQLEDDWARVEIAVLAAISRGDHIHA
jgi:very-short-patch-repair endonuclease